ncbi:MAG: hypothetical protein MJ237_04875 [bacterium]|nr:hypothetical protein [bacterium]
MAQNTKEKRIPKKMGMAASQARSQALTARMNNVEYMGQQINQQRTTLSNQINALYNSLLTMDVPTPPSVSNYTKVIYNGLDQASAFTLGNITPTSDNYYTIEFAYQRPGHFLAESDRAYAVHDSEQNVWSVNDNPIYRLSDDALHQMGITQDTVNKYTEAIMHTFAEYGVGDENTIQNDWGLYSQETDGIVKTYFIRISDLASITSQDVAYPQRYEYIANGLYTETETKENCTLTFDSSGRITEVSVPIYDETDETGRRSLTLTPETVTDNLAYENAMNEYTYAQAIYDQQVEEINAKTSIIQQEDRNLELKLTRLDTERKAIETELEAVNKVVDGNIEKSFKTFSG